LLKAVAGFAEQRTDRRFSFIHKAVLDRGSTVPSMMSLVVDGYIMRLVGDAKDAYDNITTM